MQFPIKTAGLFAVYVTFSTVISYSADAPKIESLSGFSPDIAMDCLPYDVSKPTTECTMVCYNLMTVISGGNGPPAVSVPPIQFPFDRLEFYSEPGRSSENWLVAGRRASVTLPNGSAVSFLLTIGTANICQYGNSGNGKVVIQKLYNRPRG